MICKMVGLFVNTLTGDDKYFFLKRGKSRPPIQIKLSKKQKSFFQYFPKFLKFRSNFEQFEKKLTLIGYVFPKLRTPRDMLR